MSSMNASVATLGDRPLQENDLREHIDPLFSRVLRKGGDSIYLANHSLGRPLDRTEDDVREGLGLWYSHLDGAWEGWQAETLGFRQRVAALIHAAGAHCIIPKASAGQGLRAVLNRRDRPLRVIASRSEFNSIDVILKAYEGRGRIQIDWVGPDARRLYRPNDFIAALEARPDLLVLSLVFYDTGQFFADIAAVIDVARACGVEILLDLYHAAGALPVDVGALDVDYAVGGCYKYLRGGPGAAWLYVHPRRLDEEPRTLDTGWFAVAAPFGFERAGATRFAQGGDGWLESTPAILPFYQARAGLEFALVIGVERLRAYCLTQQSLFLAELSKHRVACFAPEQPRGAFVAIPHSGAASIVDRLGAEGIIADAREGFLRFCPDILNSSRELCEAARRIAGVVRR
ncbi:aminotransferase class V-fold PLP-dependent enzyme [Methylocystis sp. IM3]|uniref:aminotransferase class V-fold PLP-dependent enzyme n=1 Tax=unclassified Methylocystis TaxID=2625913 RepID=UPI0030FC7A12